MSSLLYYGIRYGYRPPTKDTQKWEWWKYEHYQVEEKEWALLAFDYFKYNRPHSFSPNTEVRIGANVLALELLQKATNNVVSTLDTYYYDENQKTHEQITLEDRPHTDLDPSQARAVGPLSQGAYVVYSEKAIIGVALTPEGVNNLVNGEVPTLDAQRKVMIAYHPFIEREREGRTSE